jgi:exodeoxyribonuclease V gamma subunit
VLGKDLPALEDREPFDLDPLEKWQLGNDLLVQRLDDGASERQAASDASFEAERARGRLPHGTPGRLEYRALHAQVGAIAQSFATEAGGVRLPSHEFALPLLGTRLTGRLDQLWRQGQLRVQYSRTGGRHELLLFIRHVVMCALREHAPDVGLPDRSLLIGRNGREAELIEFAPLRDPVRLLRDLLQVYAAGLSGPLPLFEQASREYANQLAAQKSPEQALSSARGKFSSNYDGAFSDVSDAYIAQFFPDFDAALEVPPPYSFVELACRLYQPLLVCRRQA